MGEKKQRFIKNIGIGLLLIASCIVITNVISENVSASSWTVNNQGGGDFLTITQALLVAIPNDIISVQFGSGTYNENININTMSVSVIGIKNGAGVAPTISAFNSGAPVVTINSIDILIEGFTITGGTDGIYSNNLMSVYYYPIIVTQCLIVGNSQAGVKIMNGAYHYITDNDILDNIDGIYALSLSNSHISQCNIFNNEYSGINLLDSDYNFVDDNIIYSNGHEGIYIEGDYNDLDGESTGRIFDNNDYYSSLTVYDVELWGDYNTVQSYEVFTTLDVTNRYGIYTHSESYALNNVKDCHVYGYDGEGSVGIWLYFFDSITGSNTNVHDNNIGALLTSSSTIDCSNSAHSNVNFYDNGISIFVADDDNSIKNAYISSTSMMPIYYYGVKLNPNLNNIKISYCKIEKQANGIEICNSEGSLLNHNYINDCQITACYYNGIYINNGEYDHIKNTEITDCIKGIYLLDCYYTYIELCSFIENFGGDYQTTAGIYINGGSYNEVDSCDFTKHYRSIWLTYTNHNNIHDCTIVDKENDEIASGLWGRNSVQIGIYIYHANNNDIEKVDFNRIGYCIGIIASLSTDITGDSSTNSMMNNIEYDAIHALNDGLSVSTGTISNYGDDEDDNSLYFEGYDISTRTAFYYSSIEGTWNPSGFYYVWQEL